MEKQQIVIIATWKVKPNHLDEVLALLPEMARKSRAEAGNMLYNAHQSANDPTQISFYEIYQDMEAVEAHKASVHYQALVVGKIIPLLENREVIIAHPLDVTFL